MKLGDDGKQPYTGGRYTPGELLKKLNSGAKKWDNKFDAIIKPECGGLVVLVCKECEMVDLSPANPSTVTMIVGMTHSCPSAVLAAARNSQTSAAGPSEQQQQQ